MPTVYEITLLTAALGSGLIAGLCFAFASFLMSAFDELGAEQAIRTMQAINSRILRSSAMTVWFGTALVAVAVPILAPSGERTLPIVAAALYLIGAILITGRGNVPLNEALDRVDPGSEEAASRWRDYRQRWGRWNGLRTLVCALACALFTLAPW